MKDADEHFIYMRTSKLVSLLSYHVSCLTNRGANECGYLHMYLEKKCVFRYPSFGYGRIHIRMGVLEPVWVRISAYLIII